MDVSRLEKLLAWGLEHGIRLPEHVKFCEAPGKGIAAFASDEVASGAAFELPHELILTSGLALEHFNKTRDGNMWLKLLLAKMRFGGGPVNVRGCDVAAKFEPYVACLPARVGSPLEWPVEMWALLQGTNLGKSVGQKLLEVVQQWRDMLAALGAELDTAVQAQAAAAAELLAAGVAEWPAFHARVAGGPATSWLSFQAFLWGHLMLTSRAFPERVLRSDCDESAVVLLPVLDLLNHSTDARVEWSGKDGFTIRQLQPLRQGQEVCNNYGGKSNEELMLGYGFAIEDNLFDHVALRVCPPAATVQAMLDAGLKLPTLDDYTTYAFERHPATSSVHDASAYSKGVLFLLGRSNVALEQLLDLFAFQEAAAEECHKALRCRLQAMQNLIELLRGRLHVIQEGEMAADEQETAAKSYPQAMATVRIYRKQQQELLRAAVKTLKRWEKETLAAIKEKTVAFKNVTKHDPGFVDELLPALFSSDVEFENYDDILLLWIILRGKSSVETPKRFQSLFAAYVTYARGPADLSEDLQTMFESKYRAWFPKGSKQVSLDEVLDAASFFMRHSYVRASTGESIIIVE
ncbi:AFL100Wp [Eremothecium gossypii ATCC 10895]|uniref:Protein-lysine N-methyltransferase n=1 Tax=Eremothecium gossypii (strain ATCC 10895 / CBS 109.51 / FGSC 9923 / NRRL Y-1056) TaxID=284811 RepID=Q755C3_EREGS|nr:AFL100Wp [Eremothecium gossypii ATCC 10895]AAS53274.2 AFL100Wp [Eremothecium gossypii ATCC 10895]